MTTHTNGRRITTHEAAVKTATVEIKALTIGGKQVTLAVFRQLEERSLFDPKTLDYCGVPWGWVNYCPKGTCTFRPGFGKAEPCGEHLHIVWQQSESLYQCRVCLWDYEDLWVRVTGSDKRVALWEQRYEELSQLDQLFIAV